MWQQCNRTDLFEHALNMSARVYLPTDIWLALRIYLSGCSKELMAAGAVYNVICQRYLACFVDAPPPRCVARYVLREQHEVN